MNEALQTMLREVDALPEEDQRRIARVLAEEVRRARHGAVEPAGRWARLVERMEREAPMAGRSEEFLANVREFRDGFDLRVKPVGG